MEVLFLIAGPIMFFVLAGIQILNRRLYTNQKRISDSYEEISAKQQEIIALKDRQIAAMEETIRLKNETIKALEGIISEHEKKMESVSVVCMS